MRSSTLDKADRPTKVAVENIISQGAPVVITSWGMVGKLSAIHVSFKKNLRERLF
jgi:hypothetical protein